MQDNFNRKEHKGNCIAKDAKKFISSFVFSSQHLNFPLRLKRYGDFKNIFPGITAALTTKPANAVCMLQRRKAAKCKLIVIKPEYLTTASLDEEEKQ